MSASAAPPSYIPSLDGLRAVSISIVFLAHAGVPLIPGGFGVTVFFFLSGYLITRLLIAEHQSYGSIAIRAFYLRRAVRLGPPLLITLACAMSLVWAGLAEGDLSVAALISQLLFYFNYFNAAAPGAGTNVDGLGILWSLSVEEQFYLLYPWVFLWIIGRAAGLRAVLGLLIAVLVWRMVRVYGLGHGEWQIYISTDTRLDSLLYGCLLALMAHLGTTAIWLPDRRMYLLLAAACAILIATFLFRDPGFRSTIRYSLQGLALIPIFHFAVNRPELWLFKPLNWKPVRRIGQYSYTLYLVHFVIIKALAFNGILSHNAAMAGLLAAGLSIAYAALIYRFVETPLKPLRRRLTGH